MMNANLHAAFVSSVTTVVVYIVYSMTHPVSTTLPATPEREARVAGSGVLSPAPMSTSVGSPSGSLRGSVARVTSTQSASGTRNTGEILVGYDEERGETDPWYRRRITRHLAHRFMKNNPALETSEGRELLSLLETKGLTFEHDWETVAQVYTDLLEYHGLRAIADWHLEEERTGKHRPPDDPEIAASERRYRRAMQESSDRHQRFFKKMAAERMERNTGVSDADFYDRLFRIRPQMGLGEINIAIGDDEVIE